MKKFHSLENFKVGSIYSVLNLWGQKQFPLSDTCSTTLEEKRVTISVQDLFSFLNFQLGLGGFWKQRSV